MDSKEYVENAVRTKSDRFYAPGVADSPTLRHNFPNLDFAVHINVDVLHALVGISTEAGELLDVAKKAMFYGKAVDYVNLDEEMGDVLWYVAIYCNARGIEIGELMQRNINKLRTRFPSSFTEEAANNRDLAAERKTLEANADAALELSELPPLNAGEQELADKLSAALKPFDGLQLNMNTKSQMEAVVKQTVRLHFDERGTSNMTAEVVRGVDGSLSLTAGVPIPCVDAVATKTIPQK